MTSPSRLAIVCSALGILGASAWLYLGSRPATGQEANATDDITKVTVPFVQKYCVGCHGGMKPKADLSLADVKDESALLKDRKLWEKVVHMVETGEMPPASRPRPKIEDTKAFARSVHALYAKLDSAKRDPGRLVMRRLNKAEYANTIRDLLYVNFNPTDDFPNDDVTGGFDNNASLLSLSPLLMERYLDAAENVLALAVPLEGSWPAPLKLKPGNGILPPPAPGDQGDPNLERGNSTPVRMLRPGKKLWVNVNAKKDAEYVCRVYAWHIDGEWGIPKLDIEMDDKVVKTFVSNGLGIGFTTFNEVRLDLKTGAHKLAVSWPVDYLDPDRRARFLEAEKQAKAAAGDETADKKGAAKAPVEGADKGGFEKTPDFEPGFHLRWFEFAGPGTKTPAQQKVLAYKPGMEPRAAAKDVLTRFASRAFRRPAEAGEVERYLALYDTTVKSGDTWEAGVRMGIQGILVSPKFLFRLEHDDQPENKGPHAVDDYALASRLSYFLWSSMPDDELFDLAAKAELHDNLGPQVKRMLADKKAEALSDNFASQWLHLRLLKIIAPDQKQFPEFDDSMRQAMFKETLMFFDSVVKEDRSILNFLDADYSFLNERLANLYGIIDTKGNHAGDEVTDPGEPIKGTKFVRVQFKDKNRGGVLTQASVLTVTSNPTRTSPVKRGKWVLEQILNDPPPPPPENVPALPEGAAASQGSLRQIMEQHRADPACANCHARMDPLGFAFENFDAIGKYRQMDNGFPVNAAGELPNGTKFDGVAGLKEILKSDRERVAKSFTEKMMTYALGRGLEYTDRPTISRVLQALASNDYRFSTLITEIVQSDPFLMRRGRDQQEE